MFEFASLSQRNRTGSLLINVSNRVLHLFHFHDELIMLFISFRYRKVKTRLRRRWITEGNSLAE